MIESVVVLKPVFSPIITAASAQVRSKLAEAKPRSQSETDRVVTYLDAIALAVKGLEAEADQLLSEALVMDWQEKDERVAFVRRCSLSDTWLDLGVTCWSGRRESNPHDQLGRLGLCH